MYDTHEMREATLALAFDYGLGGSHVAGYLQRVVASGLSHERWARWDTTATTLDGLHERATHSSRLAWGTAAVLDLTDEAGCIALTMISRGVLHLHLAAGTVDALAGGEAFLRERLPERIPTEDQTIPFAFWSLGQYGPAESTRSIEVPSWPDIQSNYPAAVGEQLEALMSPDFRSGVRGQLILWYGEPGTGKTYALRALGWEWREWCSFHYVTDPETFFGRPDYMLEVILGDEEGDEDNEPRWRILILEDTGELLATDAKAQAGQGLSRLLNVVDGIIGQGLRVLVLVTTNDELHQLHPAVSRPGRCLARVEFAPFPSDEAERWLDENGIERDGRSGTLANLFAAAAGESVPERLPVGFVR